MKQSSSVARESAFTLIELLVVVVIIAILAGLLLPVASHVRDQGDSTKCLANLRQIGAAIGTYSADNNDELPGPLNLDQQPIFTKDSEGSLPRKLAKYLDLSETTDGDNTPINRNNVFLCPSYLRQFKKGEGVVYAMNMKKVPAYNRPAWGDMGGGDETKEPLRRAALAAWTDTTQNDAAGNPRTLSLTKLFAMRDTDQQDTQRDGQSSGAAPRAMKPLHGDHRNALFFDLHVGQLKLTEQQSNSPADELY